MINGENEKNNLFKNLFAHFKNRDKFIQIFSVVENQAFLIIVEEYLPMGNFYDFIYSKIKNTFSEDETFYIISNLLSLIEEVHLQKKVLFNIFPENLYFKRKDFIISHLSNNRLMQILRGSDSMNVNIYYSSPQLLEGKKLSLEIDFW